MEILHKCPFCENNNVELFYWDNALVWKLHCPVCNITYTNIDKEKIIKFWNNRPKENALQDNINTLKEELLIAKTFNGVSDTASYVDMRNERDILQAKLDVSKEDIEKITASYSTMKNKYDILQKSFEENIKLAKKENDALQGKLDNTEAIHLRRMEAVEYNNTLKINDAQTKTETLKNDMQAITVSYTNMRNKYDILKKSFDEYIELSKKENDALQIKTDNQERKYQQYIDVMQTNINIIDEKLHKIIWSYNYKLDGIKLDENKIVDDMMKKIKGEHAKWK